MSNTLTFTVCPVCLLSPSPLPKSPEACETERERRYIKAFVLNRIKLILKHNHSQRQSRPRRHTNAPRPEGFPPLSALQSRPKNTQTQTYWRHFISPWWPNSLFAIRHDISFLWNLQRGRKYERNDSWGDTLIQLTCLWMTFLHLEPYSVF